MSNQTPGDDLSEEDRRNVFRDELRQTTENGAGRIVGRVPKKVLWGGVTVLAVLGLGGQAVEHYFGNIGLPSTSAPTTTFAPPPTSPAHTTTTGSTAFANAAFIGLKPIASAAAPAFELTDQHGQTYGTAQARGRTTLITFFNKNCNDICPVEGAEIKTLLTTLGSARKLNVIIVNTDPFSYATSATPLALTRTGLSSFTNVHFVTGPVARLNAVWKAYAVQVNVGATASEVRHNSLICFVGPSSGLAAIATPFAKVSHGNFTLPSRDITRFAEGLRSETVSLN